MSTITISTFQLPNWQVAGTPITLKIIANDTFITSAGQQITRNSGNTNFYQTVSCTVSGTTVTVPQFTLDSTTDSSVVNATYTGVLYDVNGKRREALFSGWKVPHTLGSTVTYDSLATYNQHLSQLSNLAAFYTSAQTDTLLNAKQNALSITNVGSSGAATLSGSTLNIPIYTGGSGNVVSLANTYSNDLATAISSIASTSTTLLVDADTTLAEGTVIPSTLKLDFTNGGVITVSGAGSITFQGQGLVDPLSSASLIKASSPVVFTNVRDFGVNTTTDTHDVGAAHGFTTGQLVRYKVTAGSAFGGLTDGGLYYVIAASSTALKFATSYANALAGTAIDLTSDGGSGATGAFYQVAIAWTGTTYPQRISTEVIDTNTNSVTDRLKALSFSFAGNAVTFIAHPRPITSYVQFYDRQSVWFRTGDYLNTYSPVDSVNVPFTLGSYSSFSSDGGARVYTSTSTENNCNVVSTGLHTSYVVIEKIHFKHGGGTDLGGNQTVASLYETSYSTIRHCVFDNTEAYAAGIIGNRQNFTDSVPTYCSIENNTAIGYGTQVFYIISGKTLKLIGNKMFLDGAVAGGQFAAIDLEPNTPWDHIEDVEIAYNYFDLRDQIVTNRGVEVQSSSGRGIRRLNIHHNEIVCDSEDESVASLTAAGIEILGGRDIDIDDNIIRGNIFGGVICRQVSSVNIRRNHLQTVTAGSARIQLYGCAYTVVEDNILNESAALLSSSDRNGQIIENGEAFISFTTADGATLDWANNNGWMFDYYKGLTIWFNEVAHTITAVSDVTTDLLNKHITISPTISTFPAAVSVVAASVDASTDTITAPANHNLVSGDVILWSPGTTAPGGAPFGEYYIIKTGSTTFKLATSHDNAIAATAIDITSSGTGTHTYTPEFRTNFTNVTYRNNYASAGDTGAAYLLISYGASQIVSTSTDKRATNLADVNYTAVHNDGLIVYTSLTSGRTVTLPTSVGVRGKEYIIKDGAGSASTHNITIDGNGSETIDGATTKVISTDYGIVRIRSNGTNWIVL